MLLPRKLIDKGEKQMSKPSILNPFNAIKFLFKKPKTLRFPFEKKEPSERCRGFHLNDWEKCTGCGNCKDICPNEAIEMVKITDLKSEEGKKNERPQIDYGRCCFCGLCVDICPPGSLRLSRDFYHIHFDTKTFVSLPKDEKTDKEHFLPEEKYSIFKASLVHRKSNYEGYSSDLKYTLFDPELTPMDILKPEDRNSSFIEIIKEYSKEQAKKEADRCLECGLCEDACPANMNISDYIHAIWEDDLKESVRQIYRTNPLPNICGRVCTHNCETACSLSHRGEAIPIRWLKRYAVDNLDYKDVKKVAVNGAIKGKNKKISIIGAGAGGLSATYYLSLMGYDITIYEKLPLAGGIMRYAIPNYRLPDEAFDKDIEAIMQLGAKIKINTEVGKDITIHEIKKNSDYVILDTGFNEGISVLPKDIRSPFIIQALVLLPKISRNEEVLVSEKILIIGGGNVAFDIGRSLSRLQREKYGKVNISLVCLETRDIMPADEEEIIEGQEEDIKIFPGWGNAKIELDGKKIKSITVECCTQVFDENHRFNPKFDTSKTKTFKADEIIEAVGQAPNYNYLEKYKDEIEFRGPKVVTDENGKTKLNWLYACGDIMKGPDVITAIATGHNIAKAIDSID